MVMRIAAACAVSLLLAACVPTRTVMVPGPVEYRDRIVVQPIPGQLLQEHDVATGPLSACPDVAAARKRELERCNADKRALRDR